MNTSIENAKRKVRALRALMAAHNLTRQRVGDLTHRSVKAVDTWLAPVDVPWWREKAVQRAWPTYARAAQKQKAL